MGLFFDECLLIQEDAATILRKFFLAGTSYTHAERNLPALSVDDFWGISGVPGGMVTGYRIFRRFLLCSLRPETL